MPSCTPIPVVDPAASEFWSFPAENLQEKPFEEWTDRISEEKGFALNRYPSREKQNMISVGISSGLLSSLQKLLIHYDMYLNNLSLLLIYNCKKYLFLKYLFSLVTKNETNTATSLTKVPVNNFEIFNYRT